MKTSCACSLRYFSVIPAKCYAIILLSAMNGDGIVSLVFTFVGDIGSFNS